MTLPAKIKAGDRVTIESVPETITVITSGARNMGSCFRAQDGEFYHIEGGCPATGRSTKVYRVVSVESDPENWPPQLGDVWKLENGRHYHYLGETTPKLLPGGNGRLYEDISLEHAKSKKPVLAYREG